MVFVVVRVDTNEGLDTLLSQLNRFELPYNVCSEDNLEAPVSTSTSSSTSVTDTADSCDVVGATVTAEVVVSGEEIDIATLLGSRSDGDDGTLEPTNGAWPDACTSEICGSFNLVPFLRSKMLHAAIHSDFKRNEEEYMKLLLLTEKCFDNPYM
ncbi:hypothetical protein COOONC_05281 [Cooperia oncophora]